jgi:hypothetical protein
MGHFQITAVTVQGEPRLEHITYVHGGFGAKTRDQAVAEVLAGTNSYYTVNPFGLTETPVEVAHPLHTFLAQALEPNGGAFLRSQPNWTTVDNLLSLPRVPAPGPIGLFSAGR